MLNPFSFCSFSWLQDCRKTFCQSVTSGKTKAKGKGQIQLFQFLSVLLESSCDIDFIFRITIFSYCKTPNPQLKRVSEYISSGMISTPLIDSN